MRRTVLIVAALVLFADLAAVTASGDRPRIDTSTLQVAMLPAEDLPPIVADRVTTTTTTTTPPTTAAPPSRPVDVPDNAYAHEPAVVIGTIEIPKLGLSVPLNQGISLRSIDRGPSHWPGTAVPGRVGNTVVAGHRVTKTKPFRHIDTLVPGDQVIFAVDGVRSVYEVTGHEVVTPDATWIVNQTPDATATLFACHPPGSARYRYVVRARLVSTSPA